MSRGAPDYTGADLIADADGLLGVYGIPLRTVGVSAGGASQLLALDYPNRVLSLVLISTSPATPGERGLPSATERYQRFVTSATVDWSDESSVIEYLVDYARARRRHVPVRRGCDQRACAPRRRARATSPLPRTTAWPPKASCPANRCPRSPSPHW